VPDLSHNITDQVFTRILGKCELLYYLYLILHFYIIITFDTAYNVICIDKHYELDKSLRYWCTNNKYHILNFIIFYYFTKCIKNKIRCNINIEQIPISQYNIKNIGTILIHNIISLPNRNVMYKK
jgi:hypothetical protein